MRWCRPRASQRGTCTTDKVAAGDKLSVNVDVDVAVAVAVSGPRAVGLFWSSSARGQFFSFSKAWKRSHTPQYDGYARSATTPPLTRACSGGVEPQADIGVDAGGRMGS